MCEAVRKSPGQRIQFLSEDLQSQIERINPNASNPDRLPNGSCADTLKLIRYILDEFVVNCARQIREQLNEHPCAKPLPEKIMYFTHFAFDLGDLPWDVERSCKSDGSGSNMMKAWEEAAWKAALVRDQTRLDAEAKGPAEQTIGQSGNEGTLARTDEFTLPEIARRALTKTEVGDIDGG